MAKITVSLGGVPQGEYPVDEPVAVVGRDASCQIRIDNLGISRTHCQLIKRGDDFVIQDMGSANGTYVNGKRIEEHVLKDGNEILLGKYALKFSLEDVAAAAPEKPKTEAGDMDDVIHTYVMDGEKIRERLGQMRAAGGPPEDQPVPAAGGEPAAPPAQAPPAPGTPTPRPAPAPSPKEATGPVPPLPRRAMDHALDFDPLKPQTQTRARPSAGTQRYTRPPAGGGSKALLYMSLATNLLLITLLGVLIAFLWKMMQQQGRAAPAPRLPTVTSPAPTQAPAEAEPAE
jgi:predicted component of type VI protein secretion system